MLGTKSRFIFSYSATFCALLLTVPTRSDRLRTIAAPRRKIVLAARNRRARAAAAANERRLRPARLRNGAVLRSLLRRWRRGGGDGDAVGGARLRLLDGRGDRLASRRISVRSGGERRRRAGASRIVFDARLNSHAREKFVGRAIGGGEPRIDGVDDVVADGAIFWPHKLGSFELWPIVRFVGDQLLRRFGAGGRRILEICIIAGLLIFVLIHRDRRLCVEGSVNSRLKFGKLKRRSIAWPIFVSHRLPIFVVGRTIANGGRI